MAIVVNRDGQHPASDRPYRTHNRTVVASPVAVTTPEYVGEIVFDTGSNTRWRAIGAANTDWIEFGGHENA